MTDGGTANGGSDQARQQKAEADKAVADAEAAQTAAEQAAAQYAEWSSPLARQQRDAQARQAVAQANQATASAQQAQISALIPDLSNVTPGTTTVQGQQSLFGSTLARLALEKATKTVADKINPLVSNPKLSVLLTASADLATSDAAYGQVVDGLKELTDAAEAVLRPDETEPAPAKSESATETEPSTRASFFALAAAGAVASAVPPLLSLLAPQRTLSSFAISPDTTAAMSLLAGHLAQAGFAVRIDDFRPVPQGQVHELELALRQVRAKLVQKKLARDAERVQADNLRISHQAEVDNLTKTLDGMLPTDAKYAELQAELGKAKDARDQSADEMATASDDVGVMTDLQTSIDTFLTAIHAVPANGTRSAYTLAALRQDLHDSAPATRVVYISTSGGSSEQLLDHRSLLFKDKFESIASVSVSYWVLDPGNGTIIAAGTAGGTSRLRGTIGGTITIESVDDPTR
jgi:trimeric autotransporter adhesin